ncbi:tetratricopeptide repeat protein [Actinomadura syzygii]|uniref:tetratricopeptide repeat protein n=1 Tax=Actinomadura syzygii TaxID=1427538 RepID=UPI001651BDC8|nr:tetratricopeptide repeat protein [Actinomadura syzygii]
MEQVRVGVVPRPADCYQDRQAAIRLNATPDENGPVALTQAATYVLVGMGGVGKTQLAAAHARSALQRGVEVLLWVNAATRDDVISTYADAALRLRLPLADRDDPERAAREFMTWTETTTQRWLVVLDDVRSPGALRGLWPAAATSLAVGQVVVTTRLRDSALAAVERSMVEIGTFTEKEACSYLSAKLEEQAIDTVQVSALARDLGYLPLALAQAATYICNADIDFATYRRLLATRLLSGALPSEMFLPDDHERIVAATWELSIDQANRAEPAGLARPVLYLLSVLDSGAIPQFVLASPPALEYLADYMPHIPQTNSMSGELVDEALRVLHRHCLIDHDRTSTYREVRVHQLVQRATRDNIAAQVGFGSKLFANIVDVAAYSLLSVWPSVERDQLGQVLRANTAALHQNTDSVLWSSTIGAYNVLGYAASSLGKRGQVAAAVTAHTDLLLSATRHLGANDIGTLSLRHALAYWQGKAGDMASATVAFEELLVDMRRVLDPDDHHFLSVRHNLADLMGRSGDVASAVAALEEILVDMERLLGPDHRDTLTSRGVLAQWRGLAGDAVGGLAATEDLLIEIDRVLGPNDPNTLAVRHSMAVLIGQTGDTARAVASFKDLLADRLRVLGPDHPDTFDTRHNLAHWRGVSRDATGAAATFASLLADEMRVLGPAHIKTITTRYCLAGWRGEAGDAIGAAAAFEELLTEVMKLPGPKRDVASIRNALAYWQKKAEQE